MHNVSEFLPKTGKLAHIHDPRTLLIEDYTTAEWVNQPLPDSLDYTPRVTSGWPIYGNDQYGDCTCAAIGHMQEVYDALVGRQTQATPQEIITAYGQITGFNPGPPPVNDNGASMIDVLNWWRKNPIAGQMIYAYTEIGPSVLSMLKRCIKTFGAAYIGLALPRTVMAQFSAGQPWDVVPGLPAENGPGTLGGHAIEYHGYNEVGFIGCSWGQIITVTYSFHELYCDESWAPLSSEWQTTPPEGVNWKDLEDDLLQVSK